MTLELKAVDDTSGLYQMSFSSDGITWSYWENYTQVKSYILSGGDGEKTVYFRVKDRAGNTASPVSDTIILDTSLSDTGSEEQIGEKKEGISIFSIIIPLIFPKLSL